jgi:hypothetical protein
VENGLGEEVRQARPLDHSLVGVGCAAEAPQPLELLLGLLRALALEALDEPASERGFGAGRSHAVALGGPGELAQAAPERLDAEPLLAS